MNFTEEANLLTRPSAPKYTPLSEENIPEPRHQAPQQQNSQETSEILELSSPSTRLTGQNTVYSPVPTDSTAIGVENNPQDATNDGSYEVVDPRGKALTQIHLVKTLFLNLALILGLVWILLMPRFDYFIVPIYGIVLGYRVATCTLDAFWTSSVTSETWPENIHGLRFIDSFGGAVCSLMFALKFFDIFPDYMFACMPVAIGVLYTACNYQTLPQPILQICIRIYYLLQVVLITLRLDGDINWDWHLILLPSMFYALFAKGGMAVFAFSMKKKMRESNPNLPRSTRLIALLWHLAHYSCFTIPLLISVFGIAQALTDTSKFQILSIIASLGITLNTIQIFFTLMAWKPVMKFMMRYEIVSPQFSVIVNGAMKSMSFQVEKKEGFFVKVSPTYYVTLDKSFSIKDKENISQIKNTLQKVKLSKLKNKDNQPSPSEPSNKSMSDLDRSGEEKVFSTETKFSAKFAHSVNDIDEYVKSGSTEASSNENEDENLCCICYKSLSDVIMANCGHGGVCYECALPMIRKKDKCLVCREKVDALHKIDPNPKFSNIVKGLELSRIVIV